MNDDYVLFYDGTCGLCRTAVRLIRTIGPRVRISYVDASDWRQLSRYPQLSPSRAMKSVHLLLPNGRLRRGYDAVTTLVGQLPVLRWLQPLLETRVMHWLGWMIYEWVTAHRHRISHVLGLG